MSDLISRQEAIEAVNNLQLELMQDEWDEITDAIKNLPSAEPKRGKWEKNEYNIPYCSECKCINNTVYRKFCPNCGADMRGEE